MGCVQVLLILMNSLMILKGLALIGIGVTVSVVLGFVGFFISTSSVALANAATNSLGIAYGIVVYLGANSTGFLIGVGCFVVFLAIFGIVAAAKKHGTLLTIAIVFLLVLLAFEIFVTTVSIVFCIQRNSLLTKERFDANDIPFLSTIQLNGQCCGINGPSDYNNNPPLSCNPFGILYTEGCGKYRGTLLPYDWYYVGPLIGITATTLLTLILSIALRVKSGKDDYSY